jgi:hypothetical protein
MTCATGVASVAVSGFFPSWLNFNRFQSSTFVQNMGHRCLAGGTKYERSYEHVSLQSSTRRRLSQQLIVWVFHRENTVFQWPTETLNELVSMLLIRALHPFIFRWLLSWTFALRWKHNRISTNMRDAYRSCNWSWPVILICDLTDLICDLTDLDQWPWSVL